VLVSVVQSCLLATNTSTINIDLVAKQTRAQDRFVGLHFFT
jgi:enoyl-CoA hydratase/3-hydroxyacyl-CoA dehydrogenase